MKKSKLAFILSLFVALSFIISVIPNQTWADEQPTIDSEDVVDDSVVSNPESDNSEDGHEIVEGYLPGVPELEGGEEIEEPQVEQPQGEQVQEEPGEEPQADESENAEEQKLSPEEIPPVAEEANPPADEPLDDQDKEAEQAEKQENTDDLQLELADEEMPEALKQANAETIDPDNLCIIGKTVDDKYYGIKTYGNKSYDIVSTKNFFELTQDQYKAAAANAFLVFKRADGLAFQYPDAIIAETGKSAGAIFTEIQFKNHMAYRYTLLNFDPTRKVPEQQDLMWSMELKKDWVVEGDSTFGDETLTSDAAYIHFNCELDGGGHKIYRNDDNVQKLFIVGASSNKTNVSLKNIIVDGSLGGAGMTPQYQGLSVVNPTNLSLKGGVVIQNCYENQNGGAAIWLSENSDLTMEGQNTIKNCISDQSGGAIYSKNSNLTIASTNFELNTAEKNGGAICFSGSSTLIVKDNCTFSKNSAKGYGGAIYVDNSASAEISVSNFTSNTGKFGGGIFTYGKCDLTNVNFTKNTATDSGGAIAVYGSPTIKLEKITAKENTASNQGGALYTGAKVKSIEVLQSIFTKNKALFGGAFSLNCKTEIKDNTAFEENEARYMGGAIYLSQGELSITDTTFKKNNAEYPGGGIFINKNNPNEVSVVESSFTENASSHGGGIYLENDSKLKVEKSTFVNNEAAYGGGICTRPIMDVNAATSQLTLSNSNFSENEAFSGGGIHTAFPTNITGCTFTDNKAQIHPSDDRTNPHDTGTGGAIGVMNHKTTISSSTFSANWAYGSGGAIEINGVLRYEDAEGKPITGTKPNIRVEISNGTVFKGNIVDVGQGGAIHTIPYQYVDPINLKNPTPDWKKQAYQNLTIASDTVFEGNRSEAGFSNPPENWPDFSLLGFAKNSFTGVNVVDEILHNSLLNNYDINYRNEPVFIIYDGNAGTFNEGGTPANTKTDQYPIDLTDDSNQNVEITITNAVPTRAGYTFTGWLGEDGKIYKAGDKLTVGGNKIFLAQWEESSTPEVPRIYTITFDANGGVFADGTDVQSYEYEQGEEITIIDAPTREGYTFDYWQGSEYQPGDKYTVVEDHTFVAQWKSNEIPEIVLPGPILPRPLTVSPPAVVKQIKGGQPAMPDNFTFRLEAVSYNPLAGQQTSLPEPWSLPLPQDAANNSRTPEGTATLIQIQGAGSGLFGQITYTKPGEYTYKITEVPNPNLPYVFARTVYTFNDHVYEQDDQLVSDRILLRDGQPINSITAYFTNEYTGPNSLQEQIQQLPATGAADSLPLSLGLMTAGALVLALRKKW